MRKIYYLGIYDTIENKQQHRMVAPTAVNKMTYIFSALEKAGYSVDVISPAPTMSNKFFKGKITPIGQHSRLKLFFTWPHKLRLLRFIGRLQIKFQTITYLLSKVKKDDTLIVYHSLSLMRIVRLLKKIRKFKLIIDVEEIYGDIQNSKHISDKELKYFQIADSYMFPAKALEQMINHSKKPYVLVHGSYLPEAERGGQFKKQEWQNKIHCVYAGNLDPRKQGALLAAKAALYLPENYHIHILGAGSKDRIALIQSQIDEIISQGSCGVSYDGCLRGENFTRFLQYCHIGLNTQTPEGKYINTSFPSKLLTYMANGLPVITVRTPIIEESAIHEYMYYYDEPTPQTIAKTIQNVMASPSTKNGRDALFELDQQFVSDLQKLLG